MSENGTIISIDGPVIQADNMFVAKMHELVEVGNERLIGEIIQLENGVAFIQVYENNSIEKLNSLEAGHYKFKIVGNYNNSENGYKGYIKVIASNTPLLQYYNEHLFALYGLYIPISLTIIFPYLHSKKIKSSSK